MHEFSATDRRALASVATQFFVNGAVFASFVPRLPELRDRVDISVGVLGLLLTVAGGFGLVGSAGVGPLVERFGTRRVMIGSALLLVGMLPVIGFATSPFVLLVGLAGLAALDVLVDAAMNLQGSWLSARRHAPVMNRLHGLWSLGTVSGGLAASQIAAAGVSLQVHLVAVSMLLLAALGFVARGLLVHDEHDLGDGGPEPDAGGQVAPRRRAPVPRSALGLFALAGAFAIAVEIISSDWAAFRLADDFGASAGFAGLGFVAFTAGMTVGRIGGDAVLVRLGADRMLALAVLLAAGGVATAAFLPNRWIVLAGYVVAGVGVATFFPRLYDDAARLPGRPGAGLGALTAGSRVALLAAPVLVGTLAASSLSVGSATGIVALPAAVIFGVVMLAERRSAAARRALSRTR